MSVLLADDRLNWPLMRENITAEDAAAVRAFLSGDQLPILTQSKQVADFERQWSQWLGVRHSVMVNSGSAANLLTLAALRWAEGPGEIIVPPLTWVSDIAAVLQNGFEPVFVDIDPRTLGMDNRQVLDKLNSNTRAVFITHVLGYNALSRDLLDELAARNIPLLEDVCESHGATLEGRKLGSLGLMSNFSFYFAHHMSTIEGGMICTNSDDYYQRLRMLRSHGMVRESSDMGLRDSFAELCPDLHPDFIFAWPAYNCRSTEINAVIGQSQLRRLDANNHERRRNLELFLGLLDAEHFVTEFAVEGSCNYAFTLLLRQPDDALRDRLMQELRRHGVEFRRGMSGGGNQLRQPYLKQHVSHLDLADFPHVEHVHFYGFYIGNYPGLSEYEIRRLCALVNQLARDCA
jgi:CDP-6-deoxy-D-xylo-4-hexulose-3-dehydrase